jgi:hypothetical protein
MSKSLQYNANTGIFKLNRTGEYYVFTQSPTSVTMKALKDFIPENNYDNPEYPLAILRHSLGKSGGELEDYSLYPDYLKKEERKRELSVAVNPDKTLKNLEYRGMKLQLEIIVTTM